MCSAVRMPAGHNALRGSVPVKSPSVLHWHNGLSPSPEFGTSGRRVLSTSLCYASVCLDALAELAQALAQTNIVERPEGELDESPKLALQPREHRTELFAPLPLLAF